MKASKFRTRMSRRQFLETAAGLTITAGTACRVWGSSTATYYQGKCLVTLQLDGGADVTQLCDPKVNTPGEPKINNWADWLEPGQAGNINFAPIADNEWLFNRFGLDMLIVNGIDAQTNSHETGKLFNWTGSNAEGKPSLSALHAAYNSPDQPLAYAVFGGTSRTSGIIGYNRFDDITLLRTLSQPRVQAWSGQAKRSQKEFDRIDQIVAAETSRFLQSSELSPRRLQNLERYQLARSNRLALKTLAEVLPSDDGVLPANMINAGGMEFWDNLKQQMQGSLLIFKSGLGSSADLSFGGFDSHENHDEIHEQLYFHLADAIGFFWEYAEQLEIADRILLVIGSDFGRTNFYNDGDGKDHWPVGSCIIMEQNALWGNRVVGVTDELHFAKRIDPVTLKESANGVLLTPAHIHKALQTYMGLDQYAQEMGFGLTNTESLPLFDHTLHSLG